MAGVLDSAPASSVLNPWLTMLLKSSTKHRELLLTISKTNQTTTGRCNNNTPPLNTFQLLTSFNSPLQRTAMVCATTDSTLLLFFQNNKIKPKNTESNSDSPFPNNFKLSTSCNCQIPAKSDGLNDRRFISLLFFKFGHRWFQRLK